MSTAATFGPASLVTVRVGKDSAATEFVVHESFLKRGEFFRRALNGAWNESTTRVINMPEDNPEDVGLYIQFIYTHKIPQEDGPDHVVDFKNDAWVQAVFWSLTKIYCLADQLQDTATRNSMVRRYCKLLNKSRRLPHADVVNYVYGSTPGRSPLRRILVDSWCEVPTEDFNRMSDELPREFLVQLTAKLIESRKHHGVEYPIGHPMNPIQNGFGLPPLSPRNEGGFPLIVECYLEEE
jgi:hypothetical protein